MKRLSLLFLLFLTTQSFSLTLEQVKAALKEKAVPRDSIEMNLRTSVHAAGVYQQTDIYIVNKGADKSYTEIKSSFLNQRSIVNGNKMKVVDLKTNRSQILDYNGEVLKSASYGNFSPLDSGEWKEPKLVSGDVYSIQGS